MQVASISGFDGFLDDLVGVAKDVGGAIGSTASNIGTGLVRAIGTSCNVAQALPPAHPYITGTQAGCAVGQAAGVIPGAPQSAPVGPTATAPAATSKPAFASKGVFTTGMIGQLMQTPVPAVMPTMGMLSKPAPDAAGAAAAVPWYKNWKVWAGVGGGVVALTAVGLVLRR